MAYSNTEADTRAKFIDPQLKSAGWQHQNIYREYFYTDGRKIVGNRRGKRKFVDYLLRYNDYNLAIVEAKKQDDEPTKGLQQVIEYGQELKVRFVYSTNGEEIYEFDIEKGKGEYVDNYPSPEELYKRITGNKNEILDKLLGVDFLLTGSMRPRYYQELAVNKTMEAIADNKKRILLTLATGTGKTFISFQIVHKLLQAKWNLEGANHRPRILFLADRNILADQAINTFNPYEKDLVKINGEEIRKRNGVVPTNAFIFFAIYQAIAEKENIRGYYKEYPNDFFDIIIIDECHRGSANESGSWRAILNHFGNAIHLGLTATPKRKDNVDTYNYFGKPIYQYSLKEGINDGFLTPYKVKRIRTNIDEYIINPDDKIVVKQDISDDDVPKQKGVYTIEDFNRSIIIPKRIELTAKAILDNINPMDKTIVFCVDQPHALSLRDCINKHKTNSDPNYCVRITSDEGDLGKNLLEQFQDNDKDIPVILTSSQMLTTGVDARNVRNIVLLKAFKPTSMVEFKQIIGRGTRIFDGKDFFTIIDFTGATNLFYDPEWDGEPSEPEYPTSEPTTSVVKAPPKSYGEEGDNKKKRRKKIYVHLKDGRELKVIDIEIRYIDGNGVPLTTTEFIEKLVGFIPELYKNEDQLREIWSKPETREKLLADLADRGFNGEQIETLKELFTAKDSDVFDVLAHLSFSSEIKTRQQRAKFVNEDLEFFEKFEEFKAQDFLRFILNRYETDGIDELKRDRLGELIKLNKLGTPKEAGKLFGGMNGLIDAFYQITDVPMLFNTSFNMAGEPLVETPEDAIRTFEDSAIDYLYFPEVHKLRQK